MYMSDNEKDAATTKNHCHASSIDWLINNLTCYISISFDLGSLWFNLDAVYFWKS
jgi:hypothetical protein